MFVLKDVSKSRFFLPTLVIFLFAGGNYLYVLATYKPAHRLLAVMEVSRDKAGIRELSERALVNRVQGIGINRLLNRNKHLETRVKALFVLANIQSVGFFEEELLGYYRREIEATESQDSIFTRLGVHLKPSSTKVTGKNISARIHKSSFQTAHRRYWEIMNVRLNSDNHIEIRSVSPSEEKGNQMIEKLVESYNRYYMEAKYDQLLVDLDDLQPVIDSNENFEISKLLNDVKLNSTYQLAMVALFDSQVLEYIKKPELDNGYRAAEVDFRFMLVQSLIVPFFSILIIYRLFYVIFE